MLGAFALLQAPFALAEVTTNSSIPESFTVFVPCANNGTGELVDFSGDLHVLSIVTIGGGNNVTIRNHFQPQGISGIGRSTGYKYQATGGNQYSTQFDNIDGFPLLFSSVSNFRIIGQGPNNNFLMHENIHLTVNANGTTTAYVDNFSIDCK
jgi:hypothetical protein